MKILLFYTDNDNSTIRPLIAGIQNINSKIEIQYCHGIYELLEAAKTISDGLCLSLLMISTREEMDRLGKSENILAHMNLIIVLPDDTPDMFLLASRFYPRFIGYQESTYHTVISVVEKIVKNEIYKHSHFEQNATGSHHN